MNQTQFAPVIGREAQRKRRLKGKELKKALRRVVVGADWRCSGGILFKDHLGWFVEVTSAIWIPSRRTLAEIRIKPTAIDPILWDIVGLPENNHLPLSFRARGAWTCRTPVAAEFDVGDELDVHGLADAILAGAIEFLPNVDGLDAERYLQFIHDAPRGYPGAYLPAEVTTLIHFAREREARALCESALARDDAGGFVWTAANGDATNFTKGVLAYLASHEAD